MLGKIAPIGKEELCKDRRSEPRIGENRLLVTYEPVEFEK